MVVLDKLESTDESLQYSKCRAKAVSYEKQIKFRLFQHIAEITKCVP